jgi:hypothetical protein
MIVKSDLVLMDSSNNIRDNGLDMASELNEFYLSQQTATNVNYINTVPSISQACNSLFLHPCTDAELISIIQKLGNKFTSGLDGIPSVIIKQSFLAIKQPLLFLANESIRSGEFPAPLKIARVVPLYKGKGDKQQMSSYRPISLLNQFSKIFETVFYNRLMTYLEAHNLLSPSQHGFRKSRSTSTASYEAASQILSDLDSRMESAALFLDFSKAFDHINHHLLLSKLTSFGIRGVSSDWSKSYLSDRQQCVSLYKNGKRYLSPPKLVKSGVPQGSVLGPVLFFLYINDLPGILNPLPGILPVLYADDTNLVLSASSINDLISMSRHATLKIEEWCKQNSLSLNVHKYSLVYFTNKNKPQTNIHSNINETCIPQNTSSCFLGIEIDSKLSWDAHVNELRSKLCSICFLIRVIRHTVSIDVLKSVYYGYFYSHVMYSVIFWGSSPKATTIFKIQKRAVRLMSNAPFNAPCRPLFKMLCILPIPCMYIYIYNIIISAKCNLQSYNSNQEYHSYNTRTAKNLHQSFV